MVGITRVMDNVLHAYERTNASYPAALVIGRGDVPWMIEEFNENAIFPAPETEKVWLYCDVPVRCIDHASGCFAIGAVLLEQLEAAGVVCEI